MMVQLIPSNDINSDLGVVNAARVSLHKKHETFIKPDDTRLMRYLARHNHISPAFHGRLYFHIASWPTARTELDFYKCINHAGFAWIDIFNSNSATMYNTYIKGSIYGWLEAVKYMPVYMAKFILHHCQQSYPETFNAFDKNTFSPEDISEFHKVQCLQESDIYALAQENPQFYKLLTVTLLVKVPIFVARQIRTSKVGIAYSDLYVESESFDFNEVSRRYVSDDPIFYEIQQWRVREGSNVKQGSTGLANKYLNEEMCLEQEDIIDRAEGLYNARVNEDGIAPEQARALLPQSMYTEFFMTATLHRLAQFLYLRLPEEVQQETREIAVPIHKVLKEHFPHWSKTYNLE